MGEHLLCTQEVIGSIPFTSTSFFVTNRGGGKDLLEGESIPPMRRKGHPAEAG